MRNVFGIILMLVFAAAMTSGCGIQAENTAVISVSASELINVSDIENEQESYDEIIGFKRYIRENIPSPTLSQIQYENKSSGTLIDPNGQYFSDNYTDIEGILTFRGNNLRSTAAFGRAQIQEKKLQKLWEATTSFRTFGGGGGWTGQPAVIRWPEEVRKTMDIGQKFKEKQDFVEVVFASLDGKIYFYDLQTGEKTRTPIDIKNTIKGSVALDPRGYPLLYVGQGLNESGKIGYRIFSLINNKELFFLNGQDGFAYRGWGAFDGAPLINKDTDTLILGGENGVLYRIKLNTDYRPTERTITVKPEISKYHYKIKGNNHQGIENSVAVYQNIAYFSDNGGSVQAVNLDSLKPLWVAPKTDDSDATIAIRVEDETPYIYTGSEVDKQGTKGISTIRKINGLTGNVVWSNEYPCSSILGAHPVNGGMLATSIMGKNMMDGYAIFTLARYNGMNKGLMIAVSCKDGSEQWRWEMPNYTWSSPVDTYDEAGNSYLLQGDSVGNMHLLSGRYGTVLDTISLNGNIESSPVVFEDIMVVATRGGKVYGIKIK